MKSRIFPWAAPILAVLALAAGSGALAQGPNHMKFRGVINDYSPASTGGPWEVRGPWSLVVKERAETADFSAALTMERSDQGVIENGGGDFNDPADRMAHTHHITLRNGKVTTVPGGFQVTGPATVTANGMFPPPFGSDIPTLTITITGATGENNVTFSNVAVVFGAPAAGHFGSNPLHGVVRSWE